MSAAERVGAIVELLELILLALPLRDLLLVRRVSWTCRKIAESSAALREARENPFVGAELALPYHCLESGPRYARIDIDLVLHFDRPLTVQSTPSPLAELSSLVYGYEKRRNDPDASPLRHGTKVHYKERRIRPSRREEWRFIELLPGTPYRLTFAFGPNRESPGFEHLADLDGALDRLEVGKGYVLSLQSDLRLSAYIGTKRFLLGKTGAGIAVESLRFERTYKKAVLRGVPGVKGIPLVGEGAIWLEVTAQYAGQSFQILEANQVVAD